jgi:alpha-tubulin suppressor-like RCC1 family protein
MQKRPPWEIEGFGALEKARVLISVLMFALGGCPRPVPVGDVPLLPSRVVPPTRWRSVSAGIDHTCAIALDRSAWCWGKNDRGQVGDATLKDRDRPARVHGLRNVALIAAGYRRTFALTTTGELWGWGTLTAGTLATGTLAADKLTRAMVLPYARPRRVNIPEPVRDYRIGQASCALTRPGNLWCWRGQWSGTPQDPKTLPRKVAGLPKIADFDSGTNHFCAVDHDGRLWCWGKNGQGQLGKITSADSAQPLRVTGLPTVAGVVCGDKNTCALTPRGAVWCWGRVGSPPRVGQPKARAGQPKARAGQPKARAGQPKARVGQPKARVGQPKALAGLGSVVSLVLGSPTTWARTRDGRVFKWKTLGAHAAPRLRVGKTGFAAGLRFGSEHRCVLDTSGRVRCWGDNAKGQLGDGSFQARAAPTLVTGLPPLKQLSVGSYHTCGLTRRGRIWCWGDDTSGQLGLGAPSRWRTPRGARPTLRSARKGAAGTRHACAVRLNGDVWCWGELSSASRMELGRPYRDTPRRVDGVRDAVALASFTSTTCALKKDSTVWCWGDGTNHTLGRPPARYQGPRPRPVHALRGVTRISVGRDHACAVKRDRKVWCWGGLFHRRAANAGPQQVLPEATALDSGGAHTCAIRPDQTVWCWGKNRWGALGDGSRKWLGQPVRVKRLRGARSVAAGFSHSCAVTSDGSVWCWGDNRQGQLGTVTPRLSTTPRRVPGLPKATAVYAGTNHSCAVTSGATIWCWGRWASARKLGQAPSPPTRVPGLRNVTHAWLGQRFSCALDGRSNVRCWGDNPNGQLGRRPPPHHPRPVLLGAP